MKKTMVLLALPVALAVSQPAQSQTRVGGLFGVNFAGQSIAATYDASELSSRTVFGLGAVVDVPLREKMTLHLEPMYLQKGAKAEHDDYETRTEMTYLEIPVLAKYTLGNSLYHDIKDRTTGMDFGLALGGGVSYPLGDKSLFAEARYSMGLKDIDTSERSSLKNKGLQFMVGATVPFGNKGGNAKGAIGAKKSEPLPRAAVEQKPQVAEKSAVAEAAAPRPAQVTAASGNAGTNAAPAKTATTKKSAAAKKTTSTAKPAAASTSTNSKPATTAATSTQKTAPKK
ncbi:outer membrane beta-barrel protein [candidate division KSB1 bacterium]|nr:outer membrane beta-barrel protein [candidate division KSB1 bacterium]